MLFIQCFFIKEQEQILFKEHATDKVMLKLFFNSQSNLCAVSNWKTKGKTESREFTL